MTNSILVYHKTIIYNEKFNWKPRVTDAKFGVAFYCAERFQDQNADDDYFGIHQSSYLKFESDLISKVLQMSEEKRAGLSIINQVPRRPYLGDVYIEIVRDKELIKCSYHTDIEENAGILTQAIDFGNMKKLMCCNNSHRELYRTLNCEEIWPNLKRIIEYPKSISAYTRKLLKTHIF